MEQRGPQPGDVYLVPDDRGQWAFALYFVQFHNGDPTAGVFRDDAGETYVCGFEELERARVADADDRANTVKVDEAAWYRQRSRVTARQRANHKLTDNQRTAIFALGRQRGLDIEDLRAMTPQGSIRRLTVREAGELIDRLKGRRVGT